MNNIDKTISSTITYQQLISLTLNDIRFSIDQQKILLLSHPSLVYFTNNISSFQILQRFSQWKYFLREKLPRLKYFRFKISTRLHRYQNLANIESIIAAFRTSF